MGYAPRLKELAPLLEDLAALGGEVAVGAAEGEVVFRAHVPNISEDLRKVWKDFLVSHAKALKAKHGLLIEVKDVEGEDWVEIVLRTV